MKRLRTYQTNKLVIVGFLVKSVFQLVIDFKANLSKVEHDYASTDLSSK